MKKFMKTCAIMALVMVLAGIIMVSLAGIVKGPEVIATIKNYVANGLEQLDSGVRFDVEADMGFDSAVPIAGGAGIQTFSASDIKNLDIEIGACELNILPSEDEFFYVHVDSAGTYQGYVSEDTLCVKAMSSTGIGATLSNENNELNLDIQAPVCAVDLYVPTNFSFEEIKLSLGAGEINGSAFLKADEMEVELAAGEINLTNLETGILNAEIGAGIFTCAANILENVDVECGMGEVNLELAGAGTDFNYDVEVAAGEVTVGEESFGGIAGDRSVNNNAAKNINIECAMGAVEVSFVN